MAQSWGGGASGVFSGARFVITVEVACGMFVAVDAAGVLRLVDGLPIALVAVAFGAPVLGEEQPMNNSAASRQAQLVETRDAGLTIREEQCWNIIACSFSLVIAMLSYPFYQLFLKWV